jgi:enoyl-CoA hydratase/carnithine racemase
MDFETIRYARADGVATITLHRPERLNAWTPAMGRDLLEAFRAADRDGDVRAVILTGAGRAFCAGADMEFFAGQIRAGGGTGAGGGDAGVAPRAPGPPSPDRVEEFPTLMQRLSKPAIAAINGYALGVGCTMTLLCDVRLAAAEAKMGFLFPRMGVMAELGSTFLLPRLVGLGRACELMFTGKQYPAADLERIGLVNQVVPGGELLSAATTMAREIAECAPLSLALTRRALYQGLSATFDAQVRHEAYALEYLYRSRDHAEAVAAWKEKRPPRFEGR